LHKEKTVSRSKQRSKATGANSSANGFETRQEKLGEFFGTGWPEIEEKKLISFPNLPKKKKGFLLEIRKPM